ncbi:OLC1v1018064C2 [Oldenlandia corymbosa var. corymbosa]|uniref:OLC1v1018064C2 n=1 Tax=Oldenlandia corymbosa var. corymbosa TaxID=529605 RepID=A0AAV1EB41_OLDCO|nr:OLC1v1018064C2 [Oldenlandia corymbosa var. corymbosa]
MVASLQSIAAAALFLASKAEETPCFLREMVIMAGEKACKWDPLVSQKPLAQQKIRQRETYDKQKETLLLGERLLLATLAFELSIELPYKPLVAAAKELKIPVEVTKVAWNYVNDWVQTTLCLEFKPQYIAAGSLYFAAQRQKYQLPDKKGNVWWMHFSVSPKQLKVFIQHMQRFDLYQQVLPSRGSRGMIKSECNSQSASLSSPESCVSNGSIAAQEPENRTQLDSEGASKLSEGHQIKKPIDVQADFRKAKGCQTSNNTSSPTSVVEEGDTGPKVEKSEQNLGLKHAFTDSHNSIDIDRIREKFKKRRLDRKMEKKVDLESSFDIDDEAWIEREIEFGLKK